MRKANRATNKTWPLPYRSLLVAIFLVVMSSSFFPLSAQNLFQRIDSILTKNYNKGNIDTTYITQPKTKWTIKAWHKNQECSKAMFRTAKNKQKVNERCILCDACYWSLCRLLSTIGELPMG